MVPLITAASACSLHNVMLPSQNYGTKKGIKCGTNLGQGFGMKRACCGGLQIKANSQNYNGDDKFSRVFSTSSIRQNFTIRAYEVDANGIASIETLMNYFQHSITYHCKTLGVHDDVAGSTKEMIKRNLVWVYSEMQVSTYRYPKWDDAVEVETWLSTAGMNAVRFNWIVRDFKTNQMLNRASSISVLMNKLTRRLSKIPEEVRREFESYLVNSRIIIKDGDKKIPKLDDTTADYICTGLRPRWSDLDINFHVNNAKYVSWILESIPQSILMNYELSAMSLKFKRECNRDSKLQSLAEVCNGVEILRGRTQWRPKPTNNFDIFNHVPEDSIKDFFVLAPLASPQHRPRAPSPVVLASFSATSSAVRKGKTATIALLLHPPRVPTRLPIARHLHLMTLHPSRRSHHQVPIRDARSTTLIHGNSSTRHNTQLRVSPLSTQRRPRRRRRPPCGSSSSPPIWFRIFFN
ncbi:hypothetical protein AHAS_Ahas13G0253100 [Arachis hypogaea]